MCFIRHTLKCRPFFQHCPDPTWPEVFRCILCRWQGKTTVCLCSSFQKRKNNTMISWNVKISFIRRMLLWLALFGFSLRVSFSNNILPKAFSNLKPFLISKVCHDDIFKKISKTPVRRCAARENYGRTWALLFPTIKVHIYKGAEEMVDKTSFALNIFINDTSEKYLGVVVVGLLLEV